MATVAVHPATADRWADLEQLFGARGACAGCWCMYFRLTQKEFNANRGEANRTALNALVESGAEPGLIAYAGDEPAGWVSVAPRTEYLRLQRSRTLKPVDDRPVWSVVCFFVARRHRRKGLTVAMLQAAVAYARSRGAQVVEGYPVDPHAEYPDTYAYHGLLSAFRKAGFIEVARAAPTRPVMRYEVPVD